MVKILVTGAAGFIGFHLAKALLENGEYVVGIDNINDYYDVNLKFSRLKELGINKESIEWNIPSGSVIFSKFRFLRMNIEDFNDLQDLCKVEKFDYIVHLAAQAGVRYSLENPSAYIQANLVGFGNILEVAIQNKIKHLVYASSSSVYGMNEKMPFSTQDNVDHPISLYAATKKANELMAHTYSHLYKLPTTGLRLFTVYGPWGRPDMAYFLFAEAISNKRPIKVFNNGNMQRDFTYIDDIVNGIVSVIYKTARPSAIQKSHPGRSNAPYRVYNIGNNSPVSLMKFINIIEKTFNVDCEKIYMPIQDGDVEATWADVDDLIEDVGYLPKTKLEDGIRIFAEWYKNYYLNDGP